MKNNVTTTTKILQILNLITIILAVWAGYYVNSGANGMTDMKTMSDRYENLLTPAGYAFSIWGLIYLGLVIFGIYQASGLFSKKGNSDVAAKTGIWFIVANLCNAAWVFAFSYEQIGLTVLIMIVIFIALLRIVQIHNLERWDAEFKTIAFLWWPISLYFGWINVALIANIACYLTSLGWTGAPFNPEVLASGVL
ncbi:MAG: tryptophan-rich sensory protein, partial [Pedobacter sp.]